MGGCLSVTFVKSRIFNISQLAEHFMDVSLPIAENSISKSNRPASHCLRCGCLASALRYCGLGFFCGAATASPIFLHLVCLCWQLYFYLVVQLTFITLFQSERERERGRNRKLTYRYNVIIAYIGLLYSTHVASTFPFYYTQLLRWLKIYIYMSVMTRDGLPKGPTGPMSSGGP